MMTSFDSHFNSYVWIFVSLYYESELEVYGTQAPSPLLNTYILT